jgi:hypothetical protein
MKGPILVRGVHRILPLGDERSTLSREGPIEHSIIGAFSWVLIASALVTPLVGRPGMVLVNEVDRVAVWNYVPRESIPVK